MQPVYNISDVILDSQKDGGGSTLKQRPVSAPDAISGEPFKCGTPSKDFDKMVTRRRKDYGEAIRKHVSRPKTASSFFGTILHLAFPSHGQYSFWEFSVSFSIQFQEESLNVLVYQNFLLLFNITCIIFICLKEICSWYSVVCSISKKFND